MLELVGKYELCVHHQRGIGLILIPCGVRAGYMKVPGLHNDGSRGFDVWVWAEHALRMPVEREACIVLACWGEGTPGCWVREWCGRVAGYLELRAARGAAHCGGKGGAR